MPDNHWDVLVRGLNLRVRESGFASWSFCYRYHKVQRRLTIGRFEDVPLTEARQRVKEHRLVLAQGRDPGREKKLTQESPMFSELGERYVEEWAKPRNRTWKADQRSLKKYFTKWKNIPVREITRSDCYSLLGSLKGEVWPNRIHALMSGVFRFAVQRDLIEVSPMSGVEKPRVEHPRDRVLTDEELKAIWKVDYPFWKLILLTCQRPGEVADMRLSDVDDERWLIPRERRKQKKPHLVPMTRAIREVLDSIPEKRIKGDGRVFETRVGRKKLPVDDAIRKDLQRTSRTLLIKLGVPLHLRKIVQGHSIPGLVETYEVYGYVEEKKEVLEKLAEEIKRIVSD